MKKVYNLFSPSFNDAGKFHQRYSFGSYPTSTVWLCDVIEIFIHDRRGGNGLLLCVHYGRDANRISSWWIAPIKFRLPVEFLRSRWTVGTFVDKLVEIGRRWDIFHAVARRWRLTDARSSGRDRRFTSGFSQIVLSRVQLTAGSVDGFTHCGFNVIKIKSFT